MLIQMDKTTFSLQKFRSKWPVLSFDALAIPIAWFLAFLLHHTVYSFLSYVLTSYSLFALAILMIVQLGCYYYFKVYRGLWRFSSLNDVSRIIRAVVSATLLVLPILSMTSLLSQLPYAVFPLYSMLLITLLCGGRLCLRQYWDSTYLEEGVLLLQRVLIIGAGLAAEGLIRDLKRTPSYSLVGLVDDNPSKRGLDVHGVRVLGSIEDLSTLVKSYQVDLILIAIPSARSVAMRRIVNHCERIKIPCRTLPSLQSLASGRVEVKALREVNIEDLLGRDQVGIQWDKMAENIHGKRVLVTGGGGSIGSELCRQIAALQPLRLLVLDNSEFNLYKIERELRDYPGIPIEIALVNIVDQVAVRGVFEAFRPHIVFHAAAYKHVPLLEEQVRVGVQNNVLGTAIVAEASVAVAVQKFILISTDKAVNPTNIMGTTKRVAEIYCQNLNERVRTQFITVRFGNVLGSMGSVVPLFQSQLEKGGPLTVTHPEMQRYFMTIAEASQLIIQAMVNGSGGEIFVLDMGEPIKISYLAEQMIRLAGKEPGKDILIEYTGLRPGEKLFEELFHASEQLVQTAHEKLYKARFRQMDWGDLVEAMRLIHSACSNNKPEELISLLKNLVPEFNAVVDPILE